MKAKALVAGIVALLLVGGGAFALTRLLGASEDEAIAFVPSDAFFYANVFIRPSNSQKMALDDVLQKFPGIESTDDAIQKLVELFDEALAEEGLDYEDDVEPWLGDQFAFYGVPGDGTEPGAALLVESKDDDAALEFIEKTAAEEDVEIEDKSYEGETYYVNAEEDDDVAVGIVEGFVIAGDEDTVKRSIDTVQTDGDTLETASKFEDAVRPLREDWIGMFYLDLASVFEAIAGAAEEAAAVQAFGFGDQQPLAAVTYAESDAFVFEATGGLPEQGELAELAKAAGREGLVPQLPAETWAAFGLNDVGNVIRAGFEAIGGGIPGFDAGQLDAMFYAETGLRLEQDVLSWIGDVAFFVQGTTLSDLGGGVVVESENPAKTTRFVQKLGDLVAQQGLRPTPYAKAGMRGFSIAFPGAPAPVFVVAGDRFAVAFGEPAAAVAAEGGETVAGSEAFEEAQDAVGNDFNIQFFVDADAAQEVYETFAPTTDAYEDEWKKYVSVFNHVVMGAKQDGDTVVQKIVVGLE